MQLREFRLTKREEVDTAMSESSEQLSEKIALPGDRRYRTSNYFLQDQLRCSEAAADFRSVRDLVSKAAGFNPQQAFPFQPVPIPIQNSQGSI